MEKQSEDKQAKRFEHKPNFDFRSKLSRDGRFWIFERIETWIIPAKYIAVVSENHAAEAARAANGTSGDKPQGKGKRDADSNG